MGMTIIAGGCRTISDDGKIVERHCKTCASRATCNLEPRARELSALFSSQWVRCEEKLPLEFSPILYVTYPSELPVGTVHHGYYDKARGCFIEQQTGALLQETEVLAWMAIPEVPVEIYASCGYYPCRSNGSGKGQRISEVKKSPVDLR